MLIFCAIAIPLLFGGWVFATHKFIHSLLNARICAVTLCVMSAVGVVGCVLTAVMFYSDLDSFSKAAEAVSVVRDNFYLFLSAELIFVGTGIFLCTVSALIKNKMSLLVPVIMPLWAAISLIWTALLSHLSRVEWFNISLYIILFGMFAAMACCIALIPSVTARVRYLSDFDLCEKELSEKNARKQRKKALSQKKKRLKSK